MGFKIMVQRTRLSKFIDSIDINLNKDEFKDRYGDASQRREFLDGAKATIQKIYEVAMPTRLDKEISTKDLEKMQEVKVFVAEAYEEHKSKLNSTRGKFWKEILDTINEQEKKARNKTRHSAHTSILPKPNVQEGRENRSYSAEFTRSPVKSVDQGRRHSR